MLEIDRNVDQNIDIVCWIFMSGNVDCTAKLSGLVMYSQSCHKAKKLSCKAKNLLFDTSILYVKLAIQIRILISGN